jgi:hypothetical protein
MPLRSLESCGRLDRAGHSLEWRPFPLLSGFLRIGGRGVRLLDDVRMHAVLPNLPNHQNLWQVSALRPGQPTEMAPNIHSLSHLR